MESRLRELESSLLCENGKTSRGMKAMRQSERRIKELTFTTDENKKNQKKMEVNGTKFGHVTLNKVTSLLAIQKLLLNWTFSTNLSF